MNEIDVLAARITQLNTEKQQLIQIIREQAQRLEEAELDSVVTFVDESPGEEVEQVN